MFGQMNFLTSFAFTQAIFPEAKTTFDNYWNI